jgi:hypothetical protein
MGATVSESIQHVGKLGASGATHQIVDALASDGCGYTLDLHRGNGDGHVVQWLWAQPVSDHDVLDSAEVTDRATGVAQQLRQLGLRSGDVTPFTTQLEDEVGLLKECPFQPTACEGPHIVACGSGLLQSPPGTV